ncbi:MAG: FAD-binding protein [Burkholderiaceae bacterium]
MSWSSARCASGMSAAITPRTTGSMSWWWRRRRSSGARPRAPGGWLWIPGTKLALNQGITEEPGAARTYLEHEAGSHFDPDRVDAFLAFGPKAIDFFTTKTCLQFDMPPDFPDYHAEAPGGKIGGRSMVTRPFDGTQLGPRVHDLGMPLPELTVFGMMLGSGKDIVHFMRAFKSVESFVYVVKRLSRHFLDVLRHGRGMTLTNGNALAGRLARAAMDLDIPVWLSSPVKSLIESEGRVAGATIEHNGTQMRVIARRGVVLACGGFPHEIERRKKLFAHAPTGREHYSPSPQANTGDGLRLAESVGAYVDPTIPNAAAWVPASISTRKDGTSGVMPHFIDRAKPGVIAVTPAGKRFANEGNSYHDFVQDLVAATPAGGDFSAWLLCDHRTLRQYGLGCVAPFPMPIGRHLKSGYLKRGQTIEALAAEIGVDGATLRTTVEEFNGPARNGEDPAFGKGSQGLQPLPGRRAAQTTPA